MSCKKNMKRGAQYGEKTIKMVRLKNKYLCRTEGNNINIGALTSKSRFANAKEVKPR